jgi:integrase
VAEGKASFHDKSVLDNASQNPSRKLENDSSPLAQPPKCPQCGSNKLHKDGLRKLSAGTLVQRWLCRDCYYRFSERPLQKKQNWQINTGSAYVSTRQVSELLIEESKNLTEVTRQEAAQREGTVTSQLSSLLLEYAWQAKKRGLAEQTIKQRVYKLKLLIKKGADLTNPESVLTVLATNNWTQATKRTLITAYQSFARTFNIQWQPPKTRVERKIPYIPTEEEISQLIAGCGRKTATFLQVLKDTAARTAEAVRIKWSDVDEKSCTIRINNPVKGSNARIVKVTPNALAMISGIARQGDYIFNPNADTMRKNFCKQRSKIARKLQNPKLNQIHLHTFRHWKATMEYNRTLNIKYVQQLLGHKKLENTDFYTQLINFENDQYHVAHARNLEEENKLIEAGFEYVRYSDKDAVAIYRKRK